LRAAAARGAAAASRLTQQGTQHPHGERLRQLRPGFADSPKVINGASDLLLAVFGEPGRHVRAAIGVSGLPRNALVELQMTVEI
jgi:hypothetical protein